MVMKFYSSQIRFKYCDNHRSGTETQRIRLVGLETRETLLINL